jgi:hypothetical protein
MGKTEVDFTADIHPSCCSGGAFHHLNFYAFLSHAHYYQCHSYVQARHKSHTRGHDAYLPAQSRTASVHASQVRYPAYHGWALLAPGRKGTRHMLTRSVAAATYNNLGLDLCDFLDKSDVRAGSRLSGPL